MAGEERGWSGWGAVVRGSAADAVVTEAEAYAGGAWRVTVEHGGPLTAAAGELLARLVGEVDAAVAAAGYLQGGTRVHRATSLTWSFPSTSEVPARVLVLAARAAADGLDPGGWIITADDYA